MLNLLSSTNINFVISNRVEGIIDFFVITSPCQSFCEHMIPFLVIIVHAKNWHEHINPIDIPPHSLVDQQIHGKPGLKL